MSNPSPLTPVAILSPCVGVCRLDARGLCEGCYRTGEEIARWRGMSETERSHYMDVVLPAREGA
jgi:predicted Fe-S protein YdhL (DUF1289 family)